MHRRRKRSRICFVHACDNIVRHQHRRRTGPDPCFERQKIRLHKALIGPLIQGNAGVGVQIIPIARKMLQHAANAGTVHFFHHSGHIFRRLLRRRAQRAGIDIIPGVGGNVAHRGKVDVDAQPQQEGRLFRRIAAQSGQTPGSVQRLGRGKLVGAQMGVHAGPHHSAALLIRTNQQRNVRRLLQFLRQGTHLGISFTLKIPAKKDHTAQMILRHILCRVLFGAAHKKQLPHLFFHCHGSDLRCNGILLLRRGRLLSGGIHRLRAGRRRFIIRQRRAAAAQQRQQQNHNRKSEKIPLQKKTSSTFFHLYHGIN